MIADSISKQIMDAMKAHDTVRLSTLKMLLSALNYDKIAKQHDLTAEEELVVVAKEAKKRKDAIDAYTKAGAVDRAKAEENELAILNEFLPEQMGDGELTGIVEATISEKGAKSLSDMGPVIGAIMAKVKGKADGTRVSALVKSKLT